MVKRVLLLDVAGCYNFWLLFDKMQFTNNHVWVLNNDNVIADFQLDGYILNVNSKSADKQTIFYKLEREVI